MNTPAAVPSPSLGWVQSGSAVSVTRRVRLTESTMSVTQSQSQRFCKTILRLLAGDFTDLCPSMSAAVDVGRLAGNDNGCRPSEWHQALGRDAFIGSRR